MATPFRPAIDLLAQYAVYHRDRRNIATHLVGVPLIVFGIGVLLSRPEVAMGGRALTPAWVVLALVVAWYLTRGAAALGLATSAALAVVIALAHQVGGGTGAWLGFGLGFFVVGWMIQFLGHYYEGRKPAFTDDPVGPIVAPMFIVLELGVAAGAFRGLADEVERRAGPTRLRDLAHP